MKPQGSDSRRRGSFLLEFTLTGVPLILTLLSLFSLCMGMWQYHTLAEAVNATVRSASAHGENCFGKTCATTVGSIATQIATRAVGIPPGQMNVTLYSNATNNISCNPLSNCLSSSTAFPSVTGNSATAVVTISASYQFIPAISFWSPTGRIIFNPVVLAANASQPFVY